MQAPDKVYILPSQHNLQYDNGGEKYIRKEAILEWAKETYLSENASQIRKVCFKQLIEKLESL